MNISPAGRGHNPPGRDLAMPGRSSHAATDVMLVFVGGVSFVGLTVKVDVSPWEAVLQSLALVLGLQVVLWISVGIARLRSKVRRFMHS